MNNDDKETALWLQEDIQKKDIAIKKVHPIIVAEKNILKLGDQLTPNQSLQSESPSNIYTFILQNDGNLVLYRQNKNTAGVEQFIWIWHSNTCGKHVVQAIFQNDGNFVIYAHEQNSTITTCWDSKTNGKGGNIMILENDGNVVMYYAPCTCCKYAPCPSYQKCDYKIKIWSIW